MRRFSASVLLFIVAIIWSSANAEFAIAKRDTNEETTGIEDEFQVPQQTVGFFRMLKSSEGNKEPEGFKPDYVTQIALKLIARMSDDPNNPTLEKKFDEAFEEHWNNPEDLFNHLRDVYNSATGRDLKDIADYRFSDK